MQDSANASLCTPLRTPMQPCSFFLSYLYFTDSICHNNTKNSEFSTEIPRLSLPNLSLINLKCNCLDIKSHKLRHQPESS